MLIGREKEQYILRQALQADRSRFVAVYGRRRVGTTFLIRETFDYTFTFQHSGLAKGNYRAQLNAFAESLKDAGAFNVTAPKNWMDAFRQLKALIRTSKEDRKVIFIDELSWMDTPRSDLLMALENFWNGFASARKDILLIICTSATSWILKTVIHDKGGLHNRVTDKIPLQPLIYTNVKSIWRAKQYRWIDMISSKVIWSWVEYLITGILCRPVRVWRRI